MSSSKKPSTSGRENSAQKTAPPDRPQKFVNFGAFIHTARVAAGIKSQALMAKKLHELGLTDASQSLIAQIETGRVTNASVNLLRKIAEACQLHVDVVRAEYLIEKMGISRTQAELLKLDIKSIDELAEWELRIKSDDLWIVAPNFVDRENQAIKKAVLHNLERSSCTLTYFVAQDSISPTKDFGQLLRTFSALSRTMNLKGSIRWFGFSEDERRMINASVVIANPDDIYGLSSHNTEGFTVISLGNKPMYGIRMQAEDLNDRITALKAWISTKENEPYSKEEKEIAAILKITNCERKLTFSALASEESR